MRELGDDIRFMPWSSKSFIWHN